MKIRASINSVLILLGVAGIVVSAQAWKRLYYSTAEIVARAELVVVGKVKPDSIVLVPHTHRPGEGASWEHHCELLISDVLKGTSSVPSVTISINYGLEPVTGGYVSNHYGFHDFRRGKTNYARDVIEVFDTGNSFETWVPITGDIRSNHIWLLRRAKVGQSSGITGVYDPQDIQPVGMKSEVLRCMNFPK